MKKRISSSLEQRHMKKLSTELYHKMKEKSKIKLLNTNKNIIQNHINEISLKESETLGHFDALNNYLLHYIAELHYKINKNAYNPEIIKKEENIIKINKNNIKKLNKLQEMHKNKLIDDKYYLENKAADYFTKEEERENKIIKDIIKKDNIIYKNLCEEKSALSELTKKFKGQVVETENKENNIKELKLKLDLNKNIK